MNKRRMGKLKEDEAVRFLEENGYQILERNYTTKMGEIDLIAEVDEYLVFLEVKYRKNTRFGHPAEAIDMNKRNRIINASRYYMQDKNISWNAACRFDAVVILGTDIQLIRDAFY